MSWLSDYVKPQLKKLLSTDDKTPENAWVKCPDTEIIIHKKELKDNLFVSPHSDYHFRMPVQDRLENLFDGEFKQIELPQTKDDPLKFKDTKKYVDRLKTYRAKTKLDDAIIVASGQIAGVKTIIAAFNFDFMGGSMGAAVGGGIVVAAELALKKKAALIIIPASGGARMQEGIISLMQMARTTAALSKISKAKLPYIALLTNPTTGGVTASFAMLGDVHIAEMRSEIGFAGKRVIAQTVPEVLPKGFQTAEYLFEHGMVDMVVHRRDLKQTIGKILNLIMVKNKPVN